MGGQPPSIGNPLTYRDGMTMTWQGGRELTGVSKGCVTTAYQYNENSIRTKKTVGASTTEYYLNGNAMIAEKKGSNLITYMFDENGERYGFLYNSTPYYYVRNIQGDVIRILNSAGSVVAKYEYDAWGKVLKVTNASGTVQTSSTFIGNVNPIRYRGYYYDSETGFYYLQSRYYDPETCRFINADDPEMVETCTNRLLSKDLFAYCDNNPVMNSDPTGHGLLPVGGPNYYEKNYKTSVSKWANKYAKLSNGVEYGAIIYRFRVLIWTWYFMGETYKGFKTQNWYTVINGLGAGLLVSKAVRWAGNKFWPVSSVTIVGFAHTHPIGHSNKPSGPDVWLKRLGWIVSLRIFPIAVYTNKKVSIAYF